MWRRLREWARLLERDVLTLWFCRRHPQTPWAARLVAAAVVAYALSPIDLIPDFIPVLGYVDDLLLVPAGIWLALRMLPPPVLHDCRRLAEAWREQRNARPRSRTAAVVIVTLWMTLAAGLGVWLWSTRTPS